MERVGGEFFEVSGEIQDEVKGKKQRSKLLFNSETLSDVKFVVRSSRYGGNDSKRGKIEIPAHKFVLSVGSPVFFKMFCGEMAENGEQIDLPDCEHEGIIELLRYIYTDKVFLNGNNVLQVLYLAEKYIVPCLVKECVKFLKTNLDTSNVLCILQFAQKYEKKELLCQCWYLIDRKTEAVLKSSEFLTIEKSLLLQLVMRNLLNIPEVELFKALERWAEKECERHNLTADAPVKRRILGEEIMQNIRFPAMTQSDFTEVVSNSKMLTEQEISNVMEHNSSAVKSPATFLEAERAGTCSRCYRFRRSEYCTGHMSNKPDEPYRIEMTVNEDILLYGVALFGNNNSNFKVTLKISNKENGKVLATKTGAYTSFYMKSVTRCPAYYGFDVLFDLPVMLKNDEYYLFEVSMEGPNSIIKGHVVDDPECKLVRFQFNDPEMDEDDDSFVGQIAEVLFKQLV